MKRIVALLTLLVLWANVYSQGNDGVERWKAKLEGAIFATPTVESQTIIVGTEKGFLYWIDAKSGVVKQKVRVPGSIRSAVLVQNNRVYVESKGNLYCYGFQDAKKLFTFKGKSNDQADFIDPWDYFHSSPAYRDGAVYYAGNAGTIYAVDALNGKLLKSISTTEKAPIRSSLTFDKDNNLYFGDNKGVVYGYNLSNNQFFLTYRTFDKQPYSTFGPITGGPVLDNGKLFVGSRNDVFIALDTKDQKVAWRLADEKGSWWPASPIIADSSIVFGGSDNYILAAHNLETGKETWKVTADYNIFCKPLATSGAIIFGTGDSYVNRTGNGSVYAVNQKSGKILSKYKPGGNVFSSPVENDGCILICTTTGMVECIDKSYFTSTASGNIAVEGSADFLFEDSGKSVAEKELVLSNAGNQAVKVTYSFKSSNSLLNGAIKVRKDRDQVYGKGNHVLHLQVNRNGLAAGDYLSQLVITISDGTKETTIEKPIKISVKGNAAANEPKVTVEQFKADRDNFSVSMVFNVSKKTTVIGKLVSAQDNTQLGEFLYGILDWGIYDLNKEIIPENLASIAPGKYKLILDMEGQTSSIDYEVKN
jgi:FOG: WD40-like repeat